jgi:hypothetical protein
MCLNTYVSVRLLSLDRITCIKAIVQTTFEEHKPLARKNPPLMKGLMHTVRPSHLAKGDHARRDCGPDSHLQPNCSPPLEPTLSATIHKHFLKERYAAFTVMHQLHAVQRGNVQSAVSVYDSATIHKHCVSSSTCMGEERLGTQAGYSPFHYHVQQIHICTRRVSRINLPKEGKKTIKHARSLSLSLFQSSREKGDTTNAKRKIIHPSSPPLSSSILINNP